MAMNFFNMDILMKAKIVGVIGAILALVHIIFAIVCIIVAISDGHSFYIVVNPILLAIYGVLLIVCYKLVNGNENGDYLAYLIVYAIVILIYVIFGIFLLVEAINRTNFYDNTEDKPNISGYCYAGFAYAMIFVFTNVFFWWVVFRAYMEIRRMPKGEGEENVVDKTLHKF